MDLLLLYLSSSVHFHKVSKNFKAGMASIHFDICKSAFFRQDPIQWGINIYFYITYYNKKILIVLYGTIFLIILPEEGRFDWRK